MSDRLVLNTWSEIAKYLQKGIRTVQRLERFSGRPVRRVDESRRCVFAFADEIDRWLENSRLGLSNPSHYEISVTDLSTGLATLSQCITQHWSHALTEKTNSQISLTIRLQVTASEDATVSESLKATSKAA